MKRKIKIQTVEVEPLSRLQLGDVIILIEGRYIVYSVTESRACCAPLSGSTVKYKTRFGDVKEYTATGNTISISPNSECEIFKRLGEYGLQQWAEGVRPESKKSSGVSAPKGVEAPKRATAPKPVKTPKVEAKLLDHPIRAVILAMGKAQWTFDEVKAALLANGIKEVADNTIRKRMHIGRKGLEPVVDIASKTLNKLRAK